MKKTLLIATGLVLTTGLAACDKKPAPAETASAENMAGMATAPGMQHGKGA